MSSTPTLLDLGPDAYAHQAQVDEVKRQVGVDHNYFDCWIYGFLENKNFNINETVAKLNRRDDFERTSLAQADITPWMIENMQKGIIQVIGNDKEGRVTFYVCTARDKPSNSRREESKKNFDMFVSYGTRLRPESKRCQMAMLINQDKASMWSNLDMTFQADIALHIAKFYPGCVDKMYICKMGRTLAALAKPIFSRLPAIVSDRIIIISDHDIKEGKLLELYDEEVLPIALGGKNDCDKQENYNRFAYTIRDYFEQLRAAVMRGSSVKEWELSNLRAAGLVEEGSRMDALKRSIIDPGMSFSRLHGASIAADGGELPSVSDANRSWSAASGRGAAGPGARDDGDDDNLATCDTVSLDVQGRPLGLATGSTARQRLYVDNTVQGVPRDLLTDYVSQFTMIESFFRINVVEMYEREWLGMLQREVEERQEISRLEDHFQTESLLRGLPPSLHILVRGFLWLSLMVMSIYFFIGTMFIAVLGVVTLVYIFFSMFAHTYNVFLYGAAFVVAALQFTIFCSRGYDLTRNTFNGKLIQALKAFGAKALLFQVIIYVFGTLGYFVLFCVMAHRHDVLTGLKYSMAYGWIVAVCLTIIYHFVFAFGFKEINKMSYRHGSRVNNAEATLYLFMDVELDDDTGNGRSTMEIFILTLIGLLAFAAGVAYIAGNGEGIFFLAATVVLVPLLLALCAVFMFANNASASSNITFIAVMYACVFWCNAVFTMTMHGWKDGWGGSLLTVLFIMLFFTITCFVSIYGPWKGAVRRWLFRIVWGLTVLHVLGCIIGLFVYNYRMGLFVMALTLHLLVCCFRTNEASNNYGIFTIVCGFAVALLACCLLGNYAMEEVYSSSVSPSLLPGFNTSAYLQATDEPVDAEGTSLPPVCLMRFPSKELGVVGMALFAKLGYSDNAAAQKADLQHWFPGFTRVFTTTNGTEIPGDTVEVSAFRKEAEEQNITVISVRTGQNTQRIIESMSMWIDQYCISFFSFLMPREYLEQIIPYISFASSLTPLQWKWSMNTLSEALAAYVNTLAGPREYIYMVGHGFTGATAAILALKQDLPVTSVIFASPAIIPFRNGIHFSEEALANRLVNIRTSQSVYNTWYLLSPHEQVIPCNGGGKHCDKLDTTIATLDWICRAS